jgi:hypothetical protein
MKPPTMRVLLEDPVYRAMFKTIPHLAPSLAYGQPWAVWGRLTTGKWRGGKFHTYADAWRVVVKAVRSTTYEDVAIVSRRQLFAPPPGAIWDYPFAWCSRCRRPTMFAVRPNHHALRDAPVLITDRSEPRDKCYYCGMRRVAMPAYHG